MMFKFNIIPHCVVLCGRETVNLVQEQYITVKFRTAGFLIEETESHIIVFLLLFLDLLLLLGGAGISGSISSGGGSRGGGSTSFKQKVFFFLQEIRSTYGKSAKMLAKTNSCMI